MDRPPLSEWRVIDAVWSPPQVTKRYEECVQPAQSETEIMKKLVNKPIVLFIIVFFITLVLAQGVQMGLQYMAERSAENEPPAIAEQADGSEASAGRVGSVQANLDSSQAEAEIDASDEGEVTEDNIVVVSGEMSEDDEKMVEESAEADTAETEAEDVVEESAETADEDAEAADDNKPRVINAPYTIYKNTLSKGWENRSWDANVNFSGFPAYDGLTAMTINYAQADGSVYLYSPEAISTDTYNVLRFWINGGTAGGQQVKVAVVDGDENVLEAIPLTPPYPNNWRQIDILLEDLGNPEAIRGVMWQDGLGEPQPVFFVDEVALVDDPLAGIYTDTEINGPELNIYVDNETHEINELIYGMNWAPEALMKELDIPINRWGGNAVTRYNYIEDASNTGNNWFFENIPPENPSPSLPRGSGADQFVQQNNRSDAETLMTLPLIGWVARADYSCGYDTEKYGDQIETDEWRPNCGAGVLVDGTVIRESDPEDTSNRINPEFVQGWIRHFINQFGTAADEDGVTYYNLDNEPMIWSHTHRDIRPEPLGIDEFWDITVAYASAVKEVDPTMKLLGPVFWGWSSYFWSDIDVADDNDPEINAPDMEAHDNLPLTVWYLREMQRYEEKTGVRLLDYLDLHFYPQSVGVAFSEVGDESVQALRLRSTRSLWDPSYVDESWINEPVYLIPRMHEWIDEYYPGTLTAITEYNWGGLEHMNGALAQADVLGIFGRENLDIANLWGPPEQDEPGAYAFRIFRNYDGLHSKFGDMSLLAESENQDQVAIYAARRTNDKALTIIVINKSNIPMTSQINLENYDGDGEMQTFRYSNANLNAIERVQSPEIEDNGIVTTFPPSSITLFVLP